MPRKPDLFDEIILYLKENPSADTSLSPDIAKELFTDTAKAAPPMVSPPRAEQTAMPQAAPPPMRYAPPPPPPRETGPAPLVPPPDCSAMNWQDLDRTVHGCTGCELCRTRTNVVFGEGPENAPLMFIGEGPGADEDAQGRPFVGRAGELLTKMITAMGFRRAEEVYIANVVKCRPPGNRTPLPEEANLCMGYLLRQIELVKPKAIVLLGATPLLYLFKMKGIMKLRGKWLDWQGIPVMPTYHPAFLLRDPNRKVETWDDLKQVMRLFGKTPPPPRRA